MRFVQVFSNPTLTWDDLKFLREHTKLPILLKGSCIPMMRARRWMLARRASSSRITVAAREWRNRPRSMRSRRRRGGAWTRASAVR